MMFSDGINAYLRYGESEGGKIKRPVSESAFDTCLYCRGLTACAADPMMFIHDDDENLLIFRITKMGEVALRKAK